MDKKVEKHPQCNHKEMKCSCMEKRDGTCLLRNPFDCPFESDEKEHTSALHEAQKARRKRRAKSGDIGKPPLLSEP